jgi:hypothetical protein
MVSSTGPETVEPADAVDAGAAGVAVALAAGAADCGPGCGEHALPASATAVTAKRKG